MTRYPIACRLNDTAQTVAAILRDEDVGSLPVVADGDSARLEGIITDRDLCCHVVAQGLDPKSTTIAPYITRDVVTCRPEQSVDSCERLMQTHRIRRMPVVDKDMNCIGILSQADLARSEEPAKLHQTMVEISKPSQVIIPQSNTG